MRHEYPASPVVGVGAVVVLDGRAVVIRRRHDPYKGQWSIPGGRLELGESLADAVRRELQEETALDVQVGPVLEVFEWIERASDGIRHHFVIVDYLCRCLGGTLCAGDDAEDAAWVGEGDLERYELSEPAKSVIRKGLQVALAARQE